MSQRVATPKRILLVRTDRLGDVVLTLPMLPALRSCFPDAHIAMLLRRYTGAIMEGNPYLDDQIWYDEEDGTLIPFEAMRRTIREQCFDTAIVVYPTFRLALLMFRSAIPVRVGTGYRSYSLLFNKRVYEHRKDARFHEVEYNLNLLKELGCKPSSPPEFLIDIGAQTIRRVDELLRDAEIGRTENVAILHPGSGGSAREWGATNFGLLAQKLAVNKTKVIITGTDKERSLVDQIVRASGDTAISFAGMLSMKELAALLKRANVFVANSTGPIHVAAAVGTPVVGLYPRHTPMSARRWGPFTENKIVFTADGPLYCDRCSGGKDQSCKCMMSVSVNEVYAAACSLMERDERVSRGRTSHA